MRWFKSSHKINDNLQFNLMRVSVNPSETDSPLLIDADAVLPFAVAL